MGEKLESDTDSGVSYNCVSRDGVDYFIGDCCYLMPSAFNFAVKAVQPKKQKSDKNSVSTRTVTLTLLYL